MDGFSNFHFNDLGQDEQIVRVIHRNWFYLLSQFFLVFFVLGIFWSAITFVPMYFPDFLGNVNELVMLFVQNFFMLALWIYCFLIWIDYYYDIWIITNERVINIEQKGMFTRKVSELRFNKIQDVTTEVIGFIPSVLNYGDVQIQTAGEQERFIFRTISDPYHIKNILMEQQKNNEKKSTERLGEMIKEKMNE